MPNKVTTAYLFLKEMYTEGDTKLSFTSLPKHLFLPLLPLLLESRHLEELNKIKTTEV